MTRTPAQLAAFKAANLAAPAAVVIVKTPAKKQPRSFRSELTEMIAEVDDMIRAASRQGHWHVMDDLLSRSAQLRKMAAARCF